MLCKDGKYHSELAHRVAGVLSGKYTTEHKRCIMHSCDNRICCNPAHLSVGSHSDNTNDMMAKGRAAIGSKVGTSVLKESDVVAIKQIGRSMKQREIAKIYGVSGSTIGKILTGINWKHI